MATYTIIKLKNLSALHMGTGKENYDFSASQLHSDTISAALAAMMTQQGKAEQIQDFLHSFVVSSAFPYKDGFYFLPRPLGKMEIHVDDCDEYISRKKLKSIRFIEQSVWSELISGKEVHITLQQLQNGFLLPREEQSFNVPYKSIVSQRVAVPRADGQDAEPFFFDWTFFDKNAGLYCLTDAEGERLKTIVSLFELLGENGIGTDKNIGGGKFTVETDTLTIADNPDADTVMTLSLYIPHEEDMPLIDMENSHFELILRGGYMAGSSENDFWHLRKKSIYTIGVGSILKVTGTLKGKIVNLCPNYNDARMHPVYRSGKPFVLPINIVSL